MSESKLERGLSLDLSLCTHTLKRNLGSKTLKAKKENHEGETMTISDKSKLEMRNQNYKQKEKNKPKRKENCKQCSCK